MATDYITVTLFTEDGVAFQGHGATEASAARAAYKIVKKRLKARGEDVPLMKSMERNVERITNGPKPRSMK